MILEGGFIITYDYLFNSYLQPQKKSLGELIQGKIQSSNFLKWSEKEIHNKGIKRINTLPKNKGDAEVQYQLSFNILFCLMIIYRQIIDLDGLQKQLLFQFEQYEVSLCGAFEGYLLNRGYNRKIYQYNEVDKAQFNEFADTLIISPRWNEYELRLLQRFINIF
ncbi:hypothetical protein pb186bvf_019895 [Paramecium bursaria]